MPRLCAEASLLACLLLAGTRAVGLALGRQRRHRAAGRDAAGGANPRRSTGSSSGIAAVIFLIVEVALIVFIVKYRNRGRPRDGRRGPADPRHTRPGADLDRDPGADPGRDHGFVFYKLPGIKDIPEASAAGEKLTVDVEGRQFYWRYVPERRVSVNELRLPAGRPVELVVTAPANDVIHSWWVPALAGKMDAIPGKVEPHLVRGADEAGGVQGAVRRVLRRPARAMLATVEAVPAPRVRQLARRPGARQEAGTSDLGEQEFDGRVRQCHGLSGKGVIGPNLASNAMHPEPDSLEQLVRERQERRCRRSGATGASTRPTRWSPTCRRSSAVAVSAEPVPSRVPWRRGRFASWVTTVDHKRIGILYLVTCLVFFVAGGILALLMRAQLARRTRTSSRRTPTTR